MIINAQSLAAIDTEFKALYQSRLAQLPTWYLRFMSMVPSASLTTTYEFYVRSSRMREWIGDRTINNLKAHSFTIRGKNFESTVGVNRNHIIYDQLGLVKAEILGLGDDKFHNYVDLIVTLLLNGHTGEYKSYDLVNFFSGAHPLADGTTIANYYADTDLTSANLATMDKNMRVIQGDNGKILHVTPTVLWFSTPMKARAEALIKKQFLTGGESNVDYGRYELLEISEFGLTEIWGLLDDTKPDKPIVHQTSYETEPRWIEEPGQKKLDGAYGFDYDGNAGYQWWQLMAAARPAAD